MSRLPGVWPFDGDYAPAAVPAQIPLTATCQEEFEWLELLNYGTRYDLTDMDRYVDEGDGEGV